MKKFFYVIATFAIIVIFSVFWEAVSAGGVSWEYDGQPHTLKLQGI